jgi:hypothetical protein
MERILLISPVVTVSRNCQMMPEISARKIKFKLDKLSLVSTENNPLKIALNKKLL